MSRFPLRYVLVCATLIVGDGMILTSARADLDVDVTTAPPAPQVEVIPQPKSGYVWSPGYWSWNGTAAHHEWVEGHWIEEHPGSHWVPDRWSQDPDRTSHWHFKPGHWEPAS